MTTRHQLTETARRTLAMYGVSQAAWLRLHSNCDRCGCPDDRCIGYHHDESDPQGCDLQYWIEDELREGLITRKPGWV